MLKSLYFVIFLFYYCDTFVLSGVLPTEKLYRLDIVHYNDFHVRFEETTVLYPVCEANDTSCLGGFARLYHEVNVLLDEKPDALLLNAGDNFQGTYWYTLMKWDIVQKFINMLPNDAYAIGNHEFDDGVEGLVPFLQSLKAPVLAANIDISEEPSLEGLVQPHTVIKKKGRKIGIIGLITTETANSSSAGKVKFLDPIETVQREANKLKSKDIDIVIVLSHCGLQIDKQIAEKVGDDIDIIVGGHSHDLLWNDVSPSHENVAGPYPILWDSNQDHKVLIVQASAFTKYLGNITVYFDQYNQLHSYEASPIFLNRSIPEDPEIKALLEPYVQKLHGLVNEVVGSTLIPLDDDPCGSGECPIGNLVADSLLDAALNRGVSEYPMFSFLLRNQIRGALPKGDIKRGAIINVMPFNNKLSSIIIKGEDVLLALERCLTNSWTQDPFKGPYFPQVSGLRLTLNVTNGAVYNVTVKESDGWQPLSPERDYHMTTFDFMAKGGAGFEMLKNAVNRTDFAVDREVFESYITLKSPLNPVLDERVTVVY